MEGNAMDLKKENDVLKQRLNLYEKDAVPRGYYVLNSIVNQQIDILAKFKIDSEISLNPKEDKKYDRVSELWTKLPAMITALNNLKSELKLTGNQKQDEKNVPFIETVAETRK